MGAGDSKARVAALEAGSDKESRHEANITAGTTATPLHPNPRGKATPIPTTNHGPPPHLPRHASPYATATLHDTPSSHIEAAGSASC